MDPINELHGNGTTHSKWSVCFVLNKDNNTVQGGMDEHKNRVYLEFTKILINDTNRPIPFTISLNFSYSALYLNLDRERKKSFMIPFLCVPMI